MIKNNLVKDQEVTIRFTIEDSMYDSSLYDSKDILVLKNSTVHQKYLEDAAKALLFAYGYYNIIGVKIEKL